MTRLANRWNQTFNHHLSTLDFLSQFIPEVSIRIINETSGVNRVCYDISNKPPVTIEWG